MSKTYLGVDIGGTAVKLGLVDENGRVLRRAERSVSFDGYKTPILDTVQTAIHEFLTADAPRLEGIAVSATGQIDSRRGVVAGTCGNFPGWIGVDIKGTLERAFGLPVTVANDANCMLLGEVWAGAAKGYTDVIGVTLGTGVGGGIILNEKIWTGEQGVGGEIGHIHVMEGEKEACNCGGHGCLEQVASAPGIARTARRMLAADNRPSTLRSLKNISAKNVLDAAKAGDALALESLNKSCYYLGWALATISMVLDPQAFLIGGGVSKAGTFLTDIIKRYHDELSPMATKKADIVLAKLGNDAGIYGAARMVLK